MPETVYHVGLAQCMLETQLADRLRNAARAERPRLYGEVYATYGEAFPQALHPADERTVEFELGFVRRFISPDMLVAEIGPGSCELAFALAACCRMVKGIDVTDFATAKERPRNFQHVRTDGIRLPLPAGEVDVVVSNQLMEHLHPEDAEEQVAEIWRILRPDGCYICVTPNRLHGPHDSSARFQEVPCPIADGSFVANGLHLKEYTNLELAALLRQAGFADVRHFAGARGRYVELPAWLVAVLEWSTRRIPPQWRKRSRLFRALLGARVVARK